MRTPGTPCTLAVSHLTHPDSPPLKSRPYLQEALDALSGRHDARGEYAGHHAGVEELQHGQLLVGPRLLQPLPDAVAQEADGEHGRHTHQRRRHACKGGWEQTSLSTGGNFTIQLRYHWQGGNPPPPALSSLPGIGISPSECE